MIRILTMLTSTVQGLPPLNRQFIHLEIEVEEVRVVQLESNPFPGLKYYEHIVERITYTDPNHKVSRFENIGMSMKPLTIQQLSDLELSIINKPRLVECTVNSHPFVEQYINAYSKHP